MSNELIGDFFGRHLFDGNAKVLLVKGAWGVGKTYFVKKYIQDNKADLFPKGKYPAACGVKDAKVVFKISRCLRRGSSSLKAVSYVSLFGVTSLKDIEDRIFSSFTVLDQEGLKKSVKLLKPFSDLMNSVDIPYVKSTAVLDGFIKDKVIKNFLICFDDLERLEGDVSVSSVLGLISHLKEEKQCKIILICNDQELSKKGKEQIDEYREKVVDAEFLYVPLIKDNLKIVWPTVCPSYVQECFERFDVNNIRIMYKVKTAIEYFDNVFGDKYSNLRSGFNEKIALLAILYHVYSKVLTLSELLSKSYYKIFSSKDEDDKVKSELLSKVKYFYEDQDAIIIDYLQNGCVDLTNYLGMLEEKDEAYRKSGIQDIRMKLWKDNYSTFAVSQEDFILAQRQFLEQYVDDLSPREVYEAVEFMRKIDDSVNLSVYLEKSINRFVGKANCDDLDDYMGYGWTKELIGVIKEKMAVKDNPYSINDLFVMLAGGNSWHPKYISYMRRFVVDDYYQWILKETNVDVIGLLREFFQRFRNLDGDDGVVIERLREALNKIKMRSNLDRARVEYLIEQKRG